MKRRRFVQPDCDFPSDEEIARAAPSTMAEAERWLAAHERENAALLAQIDADTDAILRDPAFNAQIDAILRDPAHDAEIAAILRDPAFDVRFERRALPAAEEERPAQQYRYRGGVAHVPAEYTGQVCTDAGPARRQGSRRVVFRDGKMTSVKAKPLELVE